MRVRAAALGCLLVAVGGLSGCARLHDLTGGDDADASGSCVGPYLDDQPPDGRFGTKPPTVRPGDRLVVHGHWYTGTCNDTGGDDPVVPLPDVTLTVTLPSGRSVELGPYPPAGADLGFAATIAVPASSGPGTVTVADGLGHTYEFEVRR